MNSSEQQRKKERLYKAARTRTLEDVRTAFEVCSVDERKEYGKQALRYAARNLGPNTLEIVKFLMEQGLKPYEKDINGYTVFTEALSHENFAVADYLLSRDDFVLSGIIPCPMFLQVYIYKGYTTKAIAHVANLIELRGIAYANIVAADIGKILNSKNPEPTKEDIETLHLLAEKIASKDWVSDAQVSSDEFLGCEVER